MISNFFSSIGSCLQILEVGWVRQPGEHKRNLHTRPQYRQWQGQGGNETATSSISLLSPSSPIIFNDWHPYVRCSWFFGGGSFSSSSSASFVSSIEPSSAGTEVHDVRMFVMMETHTIKGSCKLYSRSAWLRYHLLTMRLYQNFKKSTKVEPIKAFVKAAKLGDWWANNLYRRTSQPCPCRFVLYQMSKNLNRSFFMDFLGQVSIRFVDEVVESDEDNDAGGSLSKL